MALTGWRNGHREVTIRICMVGSDPEVGPQVRDFFHGELEVLLTLSAVGNIEPAAYLAYVCTLGAAC